MNLVAGLGIAPSLGDYEPPVRLYTTPHVVEILYLFNSMDFNGKEVLKFFQNCRFLRFCFY